MVQSDLLEYYHGIFLEYLHQGRQLRQLASYKCSVTHHHWMNSAVSMKTNIIYISLTTQLLTGGTYMT